MMMDGVWTDDQRSGVESSPMPSRQDSHRLCILQASAQLSLSFTTRPLPFLLPPHSRTLLPIALKHSLLMLRPLYLLCQSP